VEDTISTDEQDDEVKADNCSEWADATVRLYAVVHDRVPVFACQYLHQYDIQSWSTTHNTKRTKLERHPVERISHTTTIQLHDSDLMIVIRILNMRNTIRIIPNSYSFIHCPKSCTYVFLPRDAKRKRGTSR